MSHHLTITVDGVILFNERVHRPMTPAQFTMVAHREADARLTRAYRNLIGDHGGSMSWASNHVATERTGPRRFLGAADMELALFKEGGDGTYRRDESTRVLMRWALTSDYGDLCHEAGCDHD